MSSHQLYKHLNKIILFIFFFVFAVFSFNCSSDDAIIQLSAEERFALGKEAFQDENYLEAIEEFKVVSLQYQGSQVADSAQFYMAESRYIREEYILAAFEYDILLRTMPSSVFASRARFRRATCFYNLSPRSYLDQNYSRKAVDEYQAFLEYHPEDSLASTAEQRISELNTKLAKKDFENGITYMHMEYYKAATYYFDLVLEKYHDTEYAEPSLLKKAEALTNRKKFSDAKETLDRFFAKYPTSSLKSDAEQLRGSVEDGLKEGEDLKQRKKEPIKDTSLQMPQSGG